MDERELIKLITTGFQRVGEQLEGREARLTRMEMTQESLSDRVERIEKGIQEGEAASNRVKVEHLEERLADLAKKVESLENWIRGLLVMVIFALVGMIAQYAKGK